MKNNNAYWRKVKQVVKPYKTFVFACFGKNINLTYFGAKEVWLQGFSFIFLVERISICLLEAPMSNFK